MANFMTPDEHIAQYDWLNSASHSAKIHTSDARSLLMEQWDMWLAYNESAMLKCAGATPKDGFGSMTPDEQLKMFYYWLSGALEDITE